LFHDVLRDVFHMDLHVFKPIHICNEVEIFDVCCHEFGAFGGEDTVEEDFDCGKVSDGSAEWAVVVGSVAASGEANTLILFFVFFVGDYYTKVGCHALARFLMGVDEMGDVGAGRLVDASTPVTAANRTWEAH
jgi:hypothetical protein